MALMLVVALLALPFVTPANFMILLPNAAAMFIVVMGLNVLAGNTGQVSFGHSGFMAVGAYAGAIAGARLPQGNLSSWILTLVIGTFAAAACGLVVGVLAARLSGFYLVLFTLMFAMAVGEVVIFASKYTGGSDGITYFGPTWLFDPKYAYWVTASVAVACVLGVGRFAHGRVGRNWSAARDSPAGATAAGVNVAFTKTAAFVLSTALAGLGGALGASYIGVVSADTYNIWLSAYLITAVVVGGLSSIMGSLIGAAFVVFVPYYSAELGVSADIVFGAILVLVLLGLPNGLVALPKQIMSTIGLRQRQKIDVANASPDQAVTASGYDTSDNTAGRTVEPLLEMNDVEVRYNGLLAVSGITLQVLPGETVALLGANGAGKTTVLRAVCGWMSPENGTICYGGRLIANDRAHMIAKAGIAHVPEGRGVFPDLTVEENLRVAAFQHASKPDLDAAFEVFPKLALRTKQVAGTLSGGEQQMLAVARALIASPRLILLDEPSLGLAPRIVEEMYGAFQAIQRAGVSILLVEQTVQQALLLADRGYVMSGGRIVAEGTSETLNGGKGLSELYLQGAAK